MSDNGKVTLFGVSYEKERQEKLLTDLYKHLFELSKNRLSNEWRNTFYVCAEEWSKHNNKNWDGHKFPTTSSPTRSQFWSLIEKKGVRETSLRIMDVYLTHNPFPSESEQQALANSLVIVNDGLLKPLLAAKKEDPPEVQILINIYGVLRRRTERDKETTDSNL